MPSEDALLVAAFIVSLVIIGAITIMAACFVQGVLS
jgi:hypothetical protein